METELHRLFFALWPGGEVREQLAQAARTLRVRQQPGGRWIGPHRYHLTLHFLGDFPAFPRLVAERAAVAAASVRAEGFELPITKAGSYSNREIPWWLGPAETPPPLRDFWRALRDALAAHSIPYDKGLRLSPHVTVLRGADRVLPATLVPAVPWTVNEFVLIHSALGPSSIYNVLGTWPLQGGEKPLVQRDLWENDAPE